MMKITNTLNVRLAEVYKQNYPTDEWAYNEMNKQITLQEIVDRMKKGECIYALMNVSDSLCRERTFSMIEKFSNRKYTYDDLYNIWLNN